MEWSFRGKDSAGRELVQLDADFDVYAAPKFAASILDHIERGGLKLKFDLSKVAYLDSTGVGALIRILQTLKRLGGDIRFSGITGSPRRVLQMSNVISLMREEG
jgi:anti-sigma B factor antagonist